MPRSNTDWFGIAVRPTIRATPFLTPEVKMNPINNAIAYANETDSSAAYQLHVTLVNGQVIVGCTYSGSEIKDSLGVEGKDGCTYVHFVNPAHILHVHLEWL